MPTLQTTPATPHKPSKIGEQNLYPCLPQIHPTEDARFAAECIKMSEVTAGTVVWEARSVNGDTLQIVRVVTADVPREPAYVPVGAPRLVLVQNESNITRRWSALGVSNLEKPVRRGGQIAATAVFTGTAPRYPIGLPPADVAAVRALLAAG